MILYVVHPVEGDGAAASHVPGGGVVVPGHMVPPVGSARTSVCEAWRVLHMGRIRAD